MKVEAKYFELLTGFFFFAGILYAVCTGIWGNGEGVGGVEWTGTVCLFLTGGLGLISGTYFRFVARRVDTRPEDYPDAEVADGAGELGFFSPHSWWPIVLAFCVGILAVAIALHLFWLVAVGVAAVLMGAAGLVFEYHRGPEKH